MHIIFASLISEESKVRKISLSMQNHLIVKCMNVQPLMIMNGFI